ncbi:MAG: hypothetical protein WAW57_15190 [Lutibacter sp.]
MGTIKAVKNIKFELASIAILKADADRMQKGISDLNSLRQQMKKTYLNAIDKANTNYGDFREAAKELGFDPNTVPEFKNYFQRQSNLDDAYYKINT